MTGPSFLEIVCVILFQAVGFDLDLPMNRAKLFTPSATLTV